MSFNFSLLEQKVNLLSGATKVELHRKGKTTYEKYEPVTGPDKVIVITANVQPVMGRELLMLPEGEREREQYFVFSRDKICSDDVIVWCGRRFEVRVVEPWQTHYEARMALIDVE